MGRVRIDPTSRLPLDPVEDPPPCAHPSSPPHVYVELTARSSFSFLQAGSSPEELVRRAATLGYDAIAITDRDGLYGMVRAQEEAARQNVRLVVGCELTIGATPPHASITVHLETHDGYKNLCRILTETHRLHPKGQPRTPEEGVPRNCFAGIPVSYICERGRANGLWCTVHDDVTDEDARTLRDAFGPRFSLAVHRHRDGEDDARIRRALRRARELDAPIVATNAVRFAAREGKLVYDVLHCIRENVTLDEAGRALASNAEAHLKPPAEMERLFSDHPTWIARSRAIATACTFKLKELRYRFPCELDDKAYEAETPDEALRRLTYEGARTRFEGDLPAAMRAQIEKELTLIAKLEVAPYFLSVKTIVEMARSRDILCQGRGSAANSAVCYCLGVTAVDPSRTNLLFERFLSAERREPPDIDVDFEHERREEVIQAIYAKYGRERAAMVCEVISYRGKSALREVGKVFGLSLEQIDRLSAVVTHWESADSADAAVPERLHDAGFDAKDERIRMVLLMARAIKGFPRHLSIHVGGFVLSSAPLEEVAPVEPATMKDRTIIPWDKDDLDTLGFFKVDVLGLGMLTAIRKALTLVQHDPRVRAPTAIDQLAKVPPEDSTIYDALCRADTVGVFQIESRAQMAMLPRLRPRIFYDLVVEVAIVRPGPIQGGMIHPYLRRRNGTEPRDPPNPILGPILDRTLGVPLFQEQVMQIAIVGAGYTGGEADQLRRDMAAWRKNGNLASHRERLARGFAERGIPSEFSDRLYQQIQGFAEYGFPESHAASFALLVYASSWIKVHHPAEFAAALINSQPMGFYSPSTILEDAKKHGVEVRGVSIEASDWDCTIEIAEDTRAHAIRVGLRQVRGLGEESGARIEKARLEGRFTTVEDLASRASLRRDELDALAEAGALESIVPGRREAMWKVRAPRGEGLFAGIDLGDVAPAMPPLTRGEQLVLDYARTGISVGDHPMRLARPTLPKRVRRSSELAAIPHGAPATSAGMVICRQRPATASGVVFITLEDEEGFINLILYTHVFERFRHVATTSALLIGHGKIERDGEVIYIVTKRLERLSLSAQVPSMSRDFH
jgi:error-prone DNA polymerase